MFSGESFTPPQFEKALNDIVQRSSQLGKSPGIAALTALDRDAWSDVREHLRSLSNTNLINLDLIQSSVCILALDEASPTVSDGLNRESHIVLNFYRTKRIKY